MLLYPSDFCLSLSVKLRSYLHDSILPTLHHSILPHHESFQTHASLKPVLSSFSPALSNPKLTPALFLTAKLFRRHRKITEEYHSTPFFHTLLLFLRQ